MVPPSFSSTAHVWGEGSVSIPAHGGYGHKRFTNAVGGLKRRELSKRTPVLFFLDQKPLLRCGKEEGKQREKKFKVGPNPC
ncbi:hypothetical protein L249_8828 [Ophiocordyceps polyrhachis-furcata BCC 54312]|uniref:Uncharacterized protein n=1 Tax=Ophiocordyceps polyrhachis-furcata BCC 54312 TaxID=1330021 RepID=A0A367L2F5_9HYPO|nr:hypothetical protein L249_8828 [Ophiocordyceps polyrhachis-furcata BCC 54312]